MFSFFRRKEIQPRIFEDAEAAFRFACEQSPPEILIESMVPALVEEEGHLGSEGESYFRIRLATREGGMVIYAPVLPEAPAKPVPGDLVGLRVVMLVDDAPPDGRIVGYLESILLPAYVDGKGWKISRRMTPQNLKPALRF